MNPNGVLDGMRCGNSRGQSFKTPTPIQSAGSLFLTSSGALSTFASASNLKNVACSEKMLPAVQRILRQLQTRRPHVHCNVFALRAAHSHCGQHFCVVGSPGHVGATYWQSIAVAIHSSQLRSTRTQLRLSRSRVHPIGAPFFYQIGAQFGRCAVLGRVLRFRLGHQVTVTFDSDEATAGIHIDRTFGGNCHHWDSCGRAVAGVGACEGIGTPSGLCGELASVSFGDIALRE